MKARHGSWYVGERERLYESHIYRIYSQVVKLRDQCPAIRSTAEKDVVVINERCLAALLALGVFCHESAMKVSVTVLDVQRSLHVTCNVLEQHHSDRLCEYLLQLIEALPRVQWHHSQSSKKGTTVMVTALVQYTFQYSAHQHNCLILIHTMIHLSVVPVLT